MNELHFTIIPRRNVFSSASNDEKVLNELPFPIASIKWSKVISRAE